MRASQHFQRLLDGLDPYNPNSSSTEYPTFAHTYDKQQLEYEYNTSLQHGLSSQTARQLLTQYGNNQLPKRKSSRWWFEWIKNDILLWIAAVYLSLSKDDTATQQHINIKLGIIAGVFLLLWSSVYYIFCNKTSQKLTPLANIVTNTVIVTRDGHNIAIEPRELVPGDIIQLSQGMSVPADIRIIDCSPDMQMDHSSLYGSSEPIAVDWKPCMETEPLQATNLCFSSSLIVSGKGRGLVIATGDNTYIAGTVKLAHKLSIKKMKQTALLKNGNQISYKVSSVTFIIQVSLLIIAEGESMNYIFVLMICFLNLIELMFLVTVVYTTISFTQKMVHQNLTIKDMEVVDVLPNITHLLTDTKGIITSNALSVSHIEYDMMECECDNDNPSETLVGDFYDKETRTRNPNFLKLVRCGTLCNCAFFEDSYLSGYRGSAIECAILKFTSGHIGAECDMNVKEFRMKHETLHQIPYNKRNKYALSIHKLSNDMIIGTECVPKSNADDKTCLLELKGEPEVILKYCDQLCVKKGMIELTEEMREEILSNVKTLRCKGLEVVAVAELILNKPRYDINIMEPIIDTLYDDDSVDKDNEILEGVYIVYNDEMTHIPIEIDEESCVYHLQELIEDILYIPMAAQRIAFSDQGLLHFNDNLHNLGIKNGSKLYVFRGPYVFEGTNPENSNFPMNKNVVFDQVLVFAYLNGLNQYEELPLLIKEKVLNYYSSHDEGFAYIGLYGVIDPMCRGIPACIRLLNALNIKTVFVTSDQHITTTKAIAQKCEIIDENTANSDEKDDDEETNVSITSGYELQTTYLDNEFWDNTFSKEYMIFSRVSSSQKLQIITKLQERGAIVGYLGDGVGDGACLKHADIGIVFGIQGSDVAKEIADVILLDDSMISLVNGINDTYKLSKYSAILILGYYLSLLVILLSSLVFVLLYDSRYRQDTDYNYFNFFIWLFWNKITVLLYSTKLIQTRIQNLKDLD